MPKLYGLASDESETVVEWFTSRREAEAALRAVLADEPAWVHVVRVIEFNLIPARVTLGLSLN
jgi:hypothetical protein